jgi:hypothetical protein
MISKFLFAFYYKYDRKVLLVIATKNRAVRLDDHDRFPLCFSIIKKKKKKEKKKNLGPLEVGPRKEKGEENVKKQKRRKENIGGLSSVSKFGFLYYKYDRKLVVVIFGFSSS